MISKSLIDKSIASALNQNWPEAIDINIEILQLNPYHIPTLNRLAKAYRETGQIHKAIKTYKQTLQYDKYNSIAQKNLNLLREWATNDSSRNWKRYNTEFIDEPGKTNTYPLIRLGHLNILRSLEAGQIVQQIVRNHNICITTDNKEHIGFLTDDISFHLKNYIDLGYTYQTVIQSASLTKIRIFIREIHRPIKFSQKPTFTF